MGTESGPSDLEALFAGAVAAHKAGDLAAAEAGYQRLLARLPDHHEARRLLAHAVLGQGRAGQAADLFLQVVAHLSGWDNYYNLGYALEEAGRPAEAEAAYRSALQWAPQAPAPRFNLAILLERLGRPLEAIDQYQQLLAAEPKHDGALNNLGLLWVRHHRPDTAEALFRQAVARQPEDPARLNNLATVLHARRAWEEARDLYARVLARNPDHGHAAGKLAYIGRQLCDWNRRQEDETRLARAVARGAPGVAPFECLSSHAVDAAGQRQAACCYAESVCGPALAAPPLVAPDSRPARQRLRVAYLSAEFHEHPVMHLLLPVLAAHRGGAMDIRLYSYGPDRDDATRRRIVALGHPFIDLAPLSDRAAAERVAADGVDILVDLTGHTGQGRAGITAHRPAPILVNWLGYPGSLGHPRLADYLIGDAELTPAGHAAHFSETLALMPCCYQPLEPPPATEPAWTRRQAELPEDGLVLCCFNQAYKITPERFATWCRLLRAVPQAVLWLLDPVESARARLRAAAGGLGVDPRRLIFAPPVALADHLARLGLADLALDTFPYTSGATAGNALAAAVPLPTRRGETYVGRMTASLLRAAGLGDLVCEDEEAYFQSLLALATDAWRRHAVRDGLRALRGQPSLFDVGRYTRDLERLYAALWSRQRRAGEGPVVLAEAEG